MRRGTTAQLVVRLSEDTVFDRFWVTFKQGDSVIVEKTESDCTVDGNLIVIPLTQEDTLAMKAGLTTPVFVQLRGLIGETAVATSISRLVLGDILKEGVIPDD